MFALHDSLFALRAEQSTQCSLSYDIINICYTVGSKPKPNLVINYTNMLQNLCGMLIFEHAPSYRIHKHPCWRERIPFNVIILNPTTTPLFFVPLVLCAPTGLKLKLILTSRKLHENFSVYSNLICIRKQYCQDINVFKTEPSMSKSSLTCKVRFNLGPLFTHIEGIN